MQQGRVFGHHLDNQIGHKLKGKKDAKEIHEDISEKENLLNDAVLSVIDKNECSPQSVYPYQHEIYEFLAQREKKSPDPRFLIDQYQINEIVRSTIVKYLVKACKTFSLLTETLFLTVDLMDQMIQNLDPHPDDLELISVTCLFISCKYEEIYPPPLWALIKGTDLKIEDVIQKEKEVLLSLNFNVIRESTIIWFQLFWELLECKTKFSEQIKLKCIQLAELSLTSSLFLNYKKSMIALCIFLAVEIMFGCQKTQFQWIKLNDHIKPSKDSKPMKLLTYLIRQK